MSNKKNIIKQMIRVNHAGEYAAKRIYEGQLQHIKDPQAYDEIKEMAKGEEAHLKYFEEQIVERKIRPTLLHFVVDKVSYGLGAVTAKLGTEAAMVCTSAVETVIADHYTQQIRYLDEEGSDANLRDKISIFRDEELEHKHTAESHDLEKAPAYKLLDKTIQTGCKIAIKLVKYL